ncbi:hypothetical protein SGUI_1723 [Serinicoccus hydrothermalis]|uniref:Uncharacterized protein n=1 Tax=Serinicoccus hydrothermalis TaxID=1758689 RepID=A0A1B1NCF5_9MICO|nr:hypothetical protein SGUI_1723 [Serinicoccus hydrothermalis]
MPDNPLFHDAAASRRLPTREHPSWTPRSAERHLHQVSRRW